MQEEEGGRQSVKQEEFGVSASDQDDLFGTQETSSHRQVGMKSKRSDFATQSSEGKEQIQYNTYFQFIIYKDLIPI